MASWTYLFNMITLLSSSSSTRQSMAADLRESRGKVLVTVRQFWRRGSPSQCLGLVCEDSLDTFFGFFVLLFTAQIVKVLLITNVLPVLTSGFNQKAPG